MEEVKAKPNIPKIKECHCGYNAHRYMVRKFISELNMETFRAFYRCENCSSRIHDDFCPKLDSAQVINVIDYKSSIDLFKKHD